MSRPRKTEAEHALTGSRQHSSTKNRAENDRPVVRLSRPKMPKDLPVESVVEWKRMVSHLLKLGTVTPFQASRLETYCRLWARWRKAEAEAYATPTLTTTWTDGAGIAHEKVVEHPSSKIASRLELNIRAYQREIIATPASRESSTPPPQPQPKGLVEKTPEEIEFERMEKLVDRRITSASAL